MLNKLGYFRRRTYNKPHIYRLLLHWLSIKCFGILHMHKHHECMFILVRHTAIRIDIDIFCLPCTFVYTHQCITSINDKYLCQYSRENRSESDGKKEKVKQGIERKRRSV